MEKLHCKACGCYSMIPMEVIVERGAGEEDVLPDTEALGDEPESCFYTCHVCGDNWLSVIEQDRGDCTITFVHQMGMSPELKRIAYAEAPVEQDPALSDMWEYFLDGEPIDEEVWLEKLAARRRVLRSICSN